MTTPSPAPANPEKRRRYDRQFCIMFRPTGTLSRAAPLAPAIPDPPPRRKVSRILGLTLPPSTLVDDLCSKLVEVLLLLSPAPTCGRLADGVEIIALGAGGFEGTGSNIQFGSWVCVLMMAVEGAL